MVENGFDVAMQFVRDHIEFVGPLVFLLGLAESTVFVSLLVPSTALFIGIGGLHSAAGGDFVPLWLAASAGATLGDMATFAIGRYFKNDVRRVWPFNTRPHWTLFARSFVRRYGALGIIASKFAGVIRPVVPLLAGSMRMPWSHFLVVSPISSLLWAGTFLAPGYALTSTLS